MIRVSSEAEMMALGKFFAENLTTLPAVFELIGDVGAGKTTFTRGLAEGLSVDESVTSPSFTISKRYCFSRANTGTAGELVHYDFYRLDDPGLMSEELAETLNNPNSVVVIEWGGDVAELLPDSKIQIRFALNEDGTRSLGINQNGEPVENLWKSQSNLCKTCVKSVENYNKTVEK